MGIGNPSRSRPQTSSPRTHYPSWGLETVRDRRLQTAVERLITPHGDWKPAGHRRSGRRPARLITPHGDWKRLPADRRNRATPAHYPSWGSETRQTAQVAELTIGLITPHGDWKRRWPRPGLTNRQLITPHGDWKPRRARPAIHAPAPHYPSWGLETPWAAPSTCIRRQLITPHGDWKPYMQSHSEARTQTHYPSWGLETRARKGSSASCATPSLPLMGIGNVGDEHRAIAVHIAHYPSWGLETVRFPQLQRPLGRSLPLMGIGNLVRAWDAEGDRMLITPHGDWKPFPFIDLCHQPLRRRPHRGVSDHRICAGPSILVGSYSQARIDPLTQQTNPGHAIGPSPAAWAHRRGHCSAE